MILSKWAGDSEKAISGVFDIAKSFQPCIIFLVRATHLLNCKRQRSSAVAACTHAQGNDAYLPASVGSSFHP
jgi:SpoVK/Ycf46/Vps4 family AAA+-type ATPase